MLRGMANGFATVDQQSELLMDQVNQFIIEIQRNYEAQVPIAAEYGQIINEFEAMRTDKDQFAVKAKIVRQHWVEIVDRCQRLRDVHVESMQNAEAFIPEARVAVSIFESFYNVFKSKQTNQGQVEPNTTIWY